MYFDPQNQPDWYQRPAVLKQAIEEIHQKRRPGTGIWRTGIALAVVLLCAFVIAILV